MESADFQQLALAIAPQAAAVANYCDHVEHNEAAETSWVLDAASEQFVQWLEGLGMSGYAGRPGKW